MRATCELGGAHDSNGARLRRDERERERSEVSERERERESTGMTWWLCSPPRPDQWGQHWPIAARWHAWPVVGQPLGRFENDHHALMNRLRVRLPPPLSPNLFVLCKNFINKSCRATCKLQLCFYGFGLDRLGFQTAMLQSRLL